MEYKIPLFDLNINEEEEKMVLETLRSGWISSGPNVGSLETECANIFGSKYAVAMTNCTAALHLCMIILDIKPGDEVIVPSLTFVATANAVIYVGATPIFADITGLDDLTINPNDIKSKISNKTKAIIVMHYGGFACNMERVLEIAEERGIPVVEDAAHGPGAEFSGKKLGTIGNLGCLSFFSNKNITSAEGGMILTNSKEYAERARLLRSHGMTTMSYDRAKGHATEYDVVELGFNYRMDDIRAGMLLAQLKKLDKDLEKRKNVREAYLDRLKKSSDLVLPYLRYDGKSSNYIFAVILKANCGRRREEIRNIMSKAGIQTSVHYPAVHLFNMYKRYRFRLPRTEYVAKNEITLPMFAKLSEENVEYIAENLMKALE